MADTVMCRVCMNENLRMFSISNTELQDTLEKLSNIKLNPDPGIQILVCYICHAHLRKCDQLRKRAMRAEILFNEMINADIKDSSETNEHIYGKSTELRYSYGITDIQCMEVTKNCTMASEEVNLNVSCVKKEKMNLVEEREEVLLNVDVKVEALEADVQIKEDNYDTSMYKGENMLQNPAEMVSKNIQRNSIVKQRKKLDTAWIKPDYFDFSEASESSIFIPETNLSTDTGSDMNNTPIKIASEDNVDGWERKSENSNHSNLYSCRICSNISDGELCIHCASNHHITESTEWNGNHGNETKQETIIPVWKSINISGTEGSLRMQKKKHVCKDCGSVYANRKTLKIHTMAKHTGERRFTCELCNYMFVKKYDLDRHTRTHTGEKPYVCEHCKYRSATRDGVRAHLARKHSKQRKVSKSKLNTKPTPSSS